MPAPVKYTQYHKQGKQNDQKADKCCGNIIAPGFYLVIGQDIVLGGAYRGYYGIFLQFAVTEEGFNTFDRIPGEVSANGSCRYMPEQGTLADIFAITGHITAQPRIGNAVG